MNPDRLIGLAYVASLFHSGQWSRGYRLLSRIRWSPRSSRAAHLQPKADYTEARQWAAHYIRYARQHPKAF